jgi:ureidoacrylate peracid hydrolase
MHEIKIAPETAESVTRRTGRRHPFDAINPRSTALVVVDMQNHFVAPGFMNETPTAREIVPAINRLAAGLREMGGQVVWIKNSTNDTWDSWSVYHHYLMTPERAKQRYASMDESAEGHQLWPPLDVRPGDTQMPKNRYSAFIQGSSDLERHLRSRGIDTILVAGTATQVCCESTARDASMLNFKTLMIADANATSTDELHNASLNAFHLHFGDVQTVDEALESLARGGREESAARAANVR